MINVVENVFISRAIVSVVNHREVPFGLCLMNDVLVVRNGIGMPTIVVIIAKERLVRMARNAIGIARKDSLVPVQPVILVMIRPPIEVPVMLKHADCVREAVFMMDKEIAPDVMSAMLCGGVF